jgi:hypothetical protein
VTRFSALGGVGIAADLSRLLETALDDLADRFPTSDAGVRPVFFAQDGEAFVPQEAARSPWNLGAMNGIAVAGLLMHAAEQVAYPAPMIPAHVTFDILRPAPYGPTLLHSVVTREGRKIQMVESHLMAGDVPVARARVLRVREAPSPHIEEPMAYPSPEDSPKRPFLPQDMQLGQFIETRQVAGEPREVGPGTVWTRLAADLVPGLATSPLVHAAMLSDFGNGVSQVVDPRRWSFANVDISLHMVRRPVGEWLLVDAEAMLQGAGVALTNMILADRTGPFGRAHQTLFIDAHRR